MEKAEKPCLRGGLKKRQTIFLCDAHQGTASTLIDCLNAKGFVVYVIANISEAADQIITAAPDVLLIGVHPPEMDVFEVCSTIRPLYNGLILFLGQNGDEAAQLLAFERGADDYIIRPASASLLAARIRAHLNRLNGSLGQTIRQIRVGDLTVDATRREVFLANRPIELTSIQFELLWYLLERRGRVVSREELYEAMYQSKYNGFDRSVDVYVSRIRQQLGDNADNPTYLKTVRGVGYLFVGDI